MNAIMISDNIPNEVIEDLNLTAIIIADDLKAGGKGEQIKDVAKSVFEMINELKMRADEKQVLYRKLMKHVIKSVKAQYRGESL